MYKQNAQELLVRCPTGADKAIDVDLQYIISQDTGMNSNKTSVSHLPHLSSWLLQATYTESRIARCHALTANNQVRGKRAGVGRYSPHMKPLDNHHDDGRAGGAWW